MVLVALTCAFVGYGGMFGVDIDDKSQVWRLQAAIWVKIKAKFEHGDKFRSAIESGMQLFLAKKADGKWLEGTGVAALTFDGDGHPQGFELMDDTLCINNDKHFGENFGPAEGEVHVLVAVPKQENDRSPAMDLLAVMLPHMLTNAPTTRTSRKKNFKDKLCNFYGCYRPGRDVCYSTSLFPSHS